MKVVIYCRVSTDDKGQDPQVQLDKCRQYCTLQGYDVIAEFKDEGISGNTYYFDRPEGSKMESIIKRYRDTQVGLGILKYA